jgi:hypothetical protein
MWVVRVCTNLVSRLLFFVGCLSPGPRKNDLTNYWALGPFVRPLTSLVDPGDIYPPHAPTSKAPQNVSEWPSRRPSPPNRRRLLRRMQTLSLRKTLQHLQMKLKPRPLCSRLKKPKGSTLGSLMNARLPSSAPAWMTNRKARSSSFCKITETYSHGNLRICWESRENWPSTN